MMKSMKCKPSDSKSKAEYASPVDAPQYPYGLKIRLEKEQLDKLGIKELPEVDSEAVLMANCVVVRVSKDESQNGYESTCCELQITEMSLMTEESGLYDEDED